MAAACRVYLPTIPERCTFASEGGVREKARERGRTENYQKQGKNRVQTSEKRDRRRQEEKAGQGRKRTREGNKKREKEK